MRDSASGPAAISPDFWSRPDVTRALKAHDIGELFRLLRKWAGLSQTRMGEATGLSQGRVSYIINGKYNVTTIKSLARIADGSTCPAWPAQLSAWHPVPPTTPLHRPRELPLTHHRIP